MCHKDETLPRRGRSRGTLQHQSSSHTRTGTWHIDTACPSTPDETWKEKNTTV